MALFAEHMARALRLAAQGLYTTTPNPRVGAVVVKDGEVIIVDEHTGRKMTGRRWSDGLHQAVEAKEGVKVENENQTLATISFQNYFRMYSKLAGMTGTADTEAAEFHSTYKLDVVCIPTNKDCIREDFEDVVYKTEKEKFTAVTKELIEANEAGRPVLVGTTSVEKSAARRTTGRCARSRRWWKSRRRP